MPSLRSLSAQMPNIPVTYLGSQARAMVGRSGACMGAVGLVLVACSPHDVVQDPKPPIALPDSFGEENPQVAPAKASAAKGSDRWWAAFEDPGLTHLVDLAFEGSFDLQAAWARLSQAYANADIAGAPRFPTLGLSAGAARNFTPARNPRSLITGSHVNSASASLNAGYELDLWAKLGSGAKAAELDRVAAFDTVQAMAMTLSAEVAEAWYDLVASRARRKVLVSQLETNRTFVELLELRFAQGQASPVEVNQQRQQVLGNHAALEQQAAAEHVLLHRIALLLGRVPERLDVGHRDQLPGLPALPEAGVPSDLLKRRPDLRAAQRRVEAADHRIAVAVADRYPSISLSGAISSEPSDFNNMLLDPLWNLAANLALPIIDGGRRRAEVDRRRAMMAEAVADYGNAVLGALIEVENALVQERQQHATITHVEERLAVSTRTLEQARQRYGQGLSDFLTVLTALRSQQEVELSLLDARRQLLSHRIQLCRALGGTWSERLQAPPAQESS
ncbi:MAG: efflux transporter outer membrane subunit [Myxococcales bacterium]|nr:efflux transporter outer membrane subunit [Myxococcales bacterium]